MYANGVRILSFVMSCPVSAEVIVNKDMYLLIISAKFNEPTKI